MHNYVRTRKTPMVGTRSENRDTANSALTTYKQYPQINFLLYIKHCVCWDRATYLPLCFERSKRHYSNTDTTQRVLLHYTTLTRQNTTENNSHAQDTIAPGPIYTELEYVGYWHLMVWPLATNHCQGQSRTPESPTLQSHLQHTWWGSTHMHQCWLALAVCGLKCHTSSANQFKCVHNDSTQIHKPPNESALCNYTQHCQRLGMCRRNKNVLT